MKRLLRTFIIMRSSSMSAENTMSLLIYWRTSIILPLTRTILSSWRQIFFFLILILHLIFLILLVLFGVKLPAMFFRSSGMSPLRTWLAFATTLTQEFEDDLVLLGVLWILRIWFECATILDTVPSLQQWPFRRTLLLYSSSNAHGCSTGHFSSTSNTLKALTSPLTSSSNPSMYLLWLLLFLIIIIFFLCFSILFPQSKTEFYPPPPPSDGMWCYRSDWPGLCLLSTLVCYQPTELIWVLLFHNFPILLYANILLRNFLRFTPPPQVFERHSDH